MAPSKRPPLNNTKLAKAKPKKPVLFTKRAQAKKPLGRGLIGSY